MTPLRRAAVAVLILTLLGLVAGCGDAEADYCAALKSKQTIFADDGSANGFLDALGDLREIGAEAPDDLRDEWQVFLAALTALRTAISDAGLQPEDIVGGVRPTGLAEEDWARITAAADELSSDAVAQAVGGIDQQAKDVCKLQLGL